MPSTGSLAQVAPSTPQAAILELDGRRLAFAWADLEEPGFEPRGADRRRVLVSKRGFSGAYRDRSVLAVRHEQLRSAQGSAALGFGSDFVAEVLAVGAEVSEVAPGDRVIPRSSYPAVAEPGDVPGVPSGRASCRREVLHAADLCRVPESLEDAVAAGFTIAAQTSYGIARRLEPLAGRRVVVSGARASTGLVLMQRLQACGAVVVALTSAQNADGVEQLRGYGAAEVVVCKRRDGTAAKAALAAEMGRCDAVVDLYARSYGPALLACLRPGGAYLTCGIGDPASPASPVAAAADGGLDAWGQVATLAICGNLTLYGHCLGVDADLDAALADCAAGRLRFPLDRVYSGDEIGAFVERSFVDPGRAGKAVWLYD